MTSCAEPLQLTLKYRPIQEGSLSLLYACATTDEPRRRIHESRESGDVKSDRIVATLATEAIPHRSHDPASLGCDESALVRHRR